MLSKTKCENEGFTKIEKTDNKIIKMRRTVGISDLRYILADVNCRNMSNLGLGPIFKLEYRAVDNFQL